MKKFFSALFFFGIIFTAFSASAQLSSGENAEKVYLPIAPHWWQTATPKEVEELLNQGASASGRVENNVIYSYIDTPIMLAAEYSKYPEIIDILVQHGANVEDENILQETPLILAALFSNYPDIIKALLKNKANPHAKNIYGQNALFYATSNPFIYNTVAYWSLKNKTQ